MYIVFYFILEINQETFKFLITKDYLLYLKNSYYQEESLTLQYKADTERSCKSHTKHQLNYARFVLHTAVNYEFFDRNNCSARNGIKALIKMESQLIKHFERRADFREKAHYRVYPNVYTHIVHQMY